MRKIIILLGLITILSGCVAAVPVAFVAGATAGGAIIYDKRSMHTMLQDHNSAAYAQNWINQDPVLKGKSHIDIQVFNHVALLVGEAETPELRSRAVKIVSTFKNISRIYDEITIQKPISFGQRADDTWITTEVKSEMLAKKGLHSTQIKVITENSVVYLMGIVTKEQANLATNIARRIKGVRKVVKAFQYI